ncbi:hemerythrin domain-containing protein [Jatrophihabitans fulvus]
MSVSRRQLITGAAGLVVGGAAGVGGAKAAEASPAAVPDVPSANEELMVEHGVLKRVLLCYRAVIDRVDAGRDVPEGVVTDGAQLVLDYVENFHEGLEEAYVFPSVRDAQPALVRTLLEQHDRGRRLTASLLGAPARLTASARPRVRQELAAFVRMYEPHEAWEDTVIYPALRAALRPGRLAELAERFQELADKEFGDAALGRALQRVTGIEQRLGIDDLASFTP